MPFGRHFEKLISKVEGRINNLNISSSNQQQGSNYSGYPQQQYQQQQYQQQQYQQQQYQQPQYQQQQYQQPQYQAPYNGSAPAPAPPPGQPTQGGPPPIPPRPADLDARADALFNRAATTTATDVFNQPISTAAPPSVFKQVDTHPVPRTGINKTGPIETNKFHANFFLANQLSPVYVQPYVLTWSAGKYTPVVTYGMAISHSDANQRVYGDRDNVTGAAKYFYNPVGIHSIILSSALLGQGTVLTTDTIGASSIMVRLRANEHAAAAVSFPVVQGMGFVTALYTGSKPVVKSAVTFRSVTRIASDPKTNVAKWKIILNDGKSWFLYAYCTSGKQITFKTVSNSHIEAADNFTGVLQVAKDPGTGYAEAVYDKAAGSYVSNIGLSGSVTGSTGTWSMNFEKHGYPNTDPVMFALPHHRESWDKTTAAAATKLSLLTPVSGNATAVVASKWTFVESNLPTDLGFAPYVPGSGPKTKLSSNAITAISSAAHTEVAEDVRAQSVLNSMYYSGKGLAKFAMIAYVANDMLKNKSLVATVLPKLKDSIETFINNTQPYPLYYETAWNGLVSSATYVTGNDGEDFGNAYYNDHHFHYGHFVLAAAVIGHIDPSWLTTERINWVNALVRDYANPSSADPYFPQWRAFDWYNGHSWAGGLYASQDGKNQESSSEDTMSIYALRMWGSTTGNTVLRDRSTIQLRVQARSLQSYYLYNSTNTAEPSDFIANRVAGIKFENKIDHTTWFGANLEYVQGIHMIPLLPCSPLARLPAFVKQEWDSLWSSGRWMVAGGWRGIILANYATVDPKTTWEYMVGADFGSSYLDGGASMTWYLAYTAAYGGL